MNVIDSIVSLASFFPSLKIPQITRYIVIEDSSILGTITEKFTDEHNANTVRQFPVLIASLSKQESFVSSAMIFS